MRTVRIIVAVLLVLLTMAAPATAARIDSLVRLQGDDGSELIGIGLVVGLKGTGDGGDFLPAMRPLAGMLKRLQDPIAIEKELKNANNVAIVTVSVTVPPAGAHAGDKLDVRVSAVAAKSLKGGRLFIMPLHSHDPRDKDPNDPGQLMVYGYAQGDLTLDDETTPTQAVIRAGKTGGGQLTADFVPEIFALDANGNKTFSLLVQPSKAGFGMATAIADQINEEVSPQTDGKPVATAVDATTILVQIPKAEAAKPAQFVSRIMQLPVPRLPGMAKVIINSKTKTIIFTGDVDIAPTVISHNGLTITVPAMGAAPAATGPAGTPANSAAVDSRKQGMAKLTDLINAFNTLNVKPEDRITIVKQLHESGALDCQLQID